MSSHDIVVGKEPLRNTGVSSGSLPIVTKDMLLKSLDEYGKPVFRRILAQSIPQLHNSLGHERIFLEY